MKKLRTLFVFIVSIFAGISLYILEVSGEEDHRSDSIRVLIQGNNFEKDKAKKTYGYRWDFGNKGFTTTVNIKQYNALLKNKNLEIALIERVTAKPKKPISTIEKVPKDNTPWGIEAIYNDSNIQQTSGGNGIKVAVLDTGVYKEHNDLLNNVEQCKDFTQNKSPITNNSCIDRNGHGTHVAGTILANGGESGMGIYGVAPEAKLWAYKVLDEDGLGYADDIAVAISHASDEAKRTSSKLIISMSLIFTTDNSLISDAVNYAYDKGALIISAAGNYGLNDNTIGYPAALPNVMAVAALENVMENGTLRVADFSSRGNSETDGDYFIQEREIEVSAPGSEIESTWNDGGYSITSGTSMAAPHISGLAAKIWSSNTTFTNSQIREELQSLAKNNDIKAGYGAGIGDDFASGFGFARME